MLWLINCEHPQSLDHVFKYKVKQTIDIEGKQLATSITAQTLVVWAG
jgi:hypothetical protein